MVSPSQSHEPTKRSYCNVSSMEKRKRIYLIYLKLIAKILLRQLSEKSDKSVSLIIFNILTPLSSQRCFLLTAFVKASQALSGKSKIFFAKARPHFMHQL